MSDSPGGPAPAAPTGEDYLEAGEPIVLGNEFSEIRVRRVLTRNGARLLIESPKSGRAVALCPLELEALTWQSTATFSAMIGRPSTSLVEDEP